MNQLAAYKSYISQLGLYMPLSANIDVILMILGLKPAIRTKFKQPDKFERIKDWCNDWNFSFYMDTDSYIYVARDAKLVKQLINLDHLTQKEEDKFGMFLGYPNCCCKKIAKIGEEHIDNYEQDLCQKKFRAFFRLINPQNYRKGTAFISHVPCSTTCFDSLFIAQKLGLFVLKNKKHPVLYGWVNELEIIYKEKLCQQLHQPKNH